MWSDTLDLLHSIWDELPNWPFGAINRLCGAAIVLLALIAVLCGFQPGSYCTVNGCLPFQSGIESTRRSVLVGILSTMNRRLKPMLCVKKLRALFAIPYVSKPACMGAAH